MIATPSFPSIPRLCFWNISVFTCRNPRDLLRACEQYFIPFVGCLKTFNLENMPFQDCCFGHSMFKPFKPVWAIRYIRHILPSFFVFYYIGSFLKLILCFTKEDPICTFVYQSCTTWLFPGVIAISVRNSSFCYFPCREKNEVSDSFGDNPSHVSTCTLLTLLVRITFLISEIHCFIFDRINYQCLLV